MERAFQRMESYGPWNFSRPEALQGFTLLELLVVMLIIGILAGLGVGGYRLARRSALEGRAKADIELLRTAFAEYRVEYGAYPDTPADTIESLLSTLPAAQRALLEQSVAGDLVVIDPWGRPYGYAFSNRFHYAIWSEGVSESTTADDINPARQGY